MNEESLKKLSSLIENCTRCDLFKNATHAVPGAGDAKAHVMFVGEAPGKNEDLQGLPFVGTSGKYLDKHLEMIGLERGDVFITSVVKHRPTANRDPHPREIAACSYWLDIQLAIIKPKVVVTLGRHSLNKFLPGAKISQVHGRVFKVGEHLVLPMYHPAAVFHSNVARAAFEEDFLNNKDLLIDPRAAKDINIFGEN